MLKLGPNRDLDAGEVRRMRRDWVEEELPQADIARAYRISVERLQLECKGLVRRCAPRAPRALLELRRA